jgi:Protein of unknown function (DUF3575)
MTLPSKLVAGLGVAAAATTIRVASAETPLPAAAANTPPADTPVDVVIHDAVPPRRILSLELNPLALIIDKLSVNVVIAPVDHHALVLSPYVVWPSTQPFYVYDDQGNSQQLPVQKFTGFGGEIGYRYYTGLGGPRGFFVGPSLIIADMNVKAQNGSSTGYIDLGVAADVGYQMIVVDSLSLAVGAGLQYATPVGATIPGQQFPADVYGSARLFPRALASIGWAF